jgi:hypothetical protein
MRLGDFAALRWILSAKPNHADSRYIMIPAPHSWLFLRILRLFAANSMEVLIHEPFTLETRLFPAKADSNPVKPSQTQSNHFFTLTRNRLVQQLNSALEEDLPWEQWFQSG